MAEPALELTAVSFFYGAECALRDVNFAIYPGDFLGVIGPNGGGKTTLIRLALGLLRQQDGTVRLLGGPPSSSRHRVGYIPQETSSNRSFPISVMDVVLMGLAPRRGLGRPFVAADRDRVLSVLAHLGIENLYTKRIGELSGGQRQKALLARALVSDPEMLILDEPTSSIDTTGSDEIYERLQELNRSGTTIVLVTHNVGVVSRYIKSIACVNKDLHFHADGKLDEDTITKTFGCPVDLIAHGFPHRVFHHHQEHEKHA